MIKEACVETFNEAIIAEKQGANRIELCTDLANDGLTPSYELMKRVCSVVKIPVMVMTRPRAGNFVFSETEIQQTKRDIDLAKKAGAAGIVMGLLTPDHRIDAENTTLLADYAKPLPVTFHKAIDLLEDPVKGVDVLKQIPNIKRILTSGGKTTALEGANNIRKMIDKAQYDTTILVAGKVTGSNIYEIQKRTGATEFHGRKIVGELY